MSAFSELTTSDAIQSFFKSPSIRISEKVFALKDELISIRRHLHRHPELSWREFSTTKYIMEYLRSVSAHCAEHIHISSGTTYEGRRVPTGVVALLKGGMDGQCVMLRADIDALPVTEQSGLPFASTSDGVAH